MVASSYLKRIIALRKEIERDSRELQRLYDIAGDAPGARLSHDRVSSGKLADTVGNTATRITHLEIELLDKAEEMVFLEKWAKKHFAILGSEAHQKVLTKRYLYSDEWVDIAGDMGYGLRHVYKIHAQGLKALEKMAPNGT